MLMSMMINSNIVIMVMSALIAVFTGDHDFDEDVDGVPLSHLDDDEIPLQQSDHESIDGVPLDFN